MSLTKKGYIKRLIDFILALMGIVILSPLFVLLIILGCAFMQGNPFFAQDRPGKIDPKTGKERTFKLYKFRSMTDKRDENGELLPGKDRMTPFGAKLRATSLDELPEIINIFKGDMSLIGPRPLAMIYLPYYTNEERVRHSVRPGLTGLAQASGRNNLKWEEKFAYDIEYANNITFLMDMKIILKTVKAVLSHEGIGQGEETPENFNEYRQRQIDGGK